MSEGPFSWLPAPIGPWGIIAFELAGSLDEARTILQAWCHPGQVRAGISLCLDYLFMAAYGTTISLLCWLVVRYRARSTLFRLGVVLFLGDACGGRLRCRRERGAPPDAAGHRPGNLARSRPVVRNSQI